MTDKERCLAKGKIRYATRREAKSELGRLRAQKRSNCTRVHYCVFCDGYHHTKDARHGGRKTG